MERRVVITGAGLISPLGNRKETLWEALCEKRSGVDQLTRLPGDVLPSPVGGEAREFTGDIGDYGPLEKQQMRAIKKGRKLMCREIEMGVASAQLALHDAGLALDSIDSDRAGVVFGSDYIMSAPDEFVKGIRQCRDEQGNFEFSKWGNVGLEKVEPLWLLKYLPNMPASHIAIYNDFRGPSNSITLREASSNLSVAEAVTTIRRGAADVMLAGSTGTRLHQMRTLHVSLQEQLAQAHEDPGLSCQPFDKNRTGMVLGEGAGAIVLETLASAQERGVPILGEVVAYASTCVSRRGQDDAGKGRASIAADYQQAIANVIGQLLKSAGVSPDDVGHYNAHGQATLRADQEEASAVSSAFAGRSTEMPVIAVKWGMGNLGAGSGMVELIASLMALQNERLFPVASYQTPDPNCPVSVVTDGNSPSGDSFITCNVTPQGQASGLLIRRV